MHLSAQLFGNALYFHHLIGLDGDFEARTRDFGREDKTDTGEVRWVQAILNATI